MWEFLQNKWFITIIGGAAAAVLANILINLFKRRRLKPVKTISENRQKTIINNKITIGAQRANSQVSPSVKKIIASGEVAYHKANTRILFIDDQDIKDKIKNLIQIGWKNVARIKDACDIDGTEIREAKIIFVDYKGVGKDCKNEGLDVIAALKERYKDSKWVILYSAHEVPMIAFDKKADSWLSKNSSPYEFEQKIVDGLGKITI